MPARNADISRILLRVMLWSLAAAAFGGAATAVLGSTTVLWQLVAMLVLMAVCAGLLLLVARYLLQPDPAAGLMATAVVLSEFLLGLLIIWDFPRLFNSGTDWALQLVFIIFFTGAPATLLLKFRRAPGGKIATMAGLLVCVATFTIWLLAVWLPWSNSDNEKVWEYGLSLMGLGTLAVGCLIGFGTDKRHWRWIGVLCLAVAYARLVWLINVEQSEMEPTVALISLGALVAYINVILRCPLHRSQELLRHATIVAMALTAVLINVGLWQHDYYHERIAQFTVERMASAAGILAACGTLAIAVLLSINRRTAPPTRPESHLVAAMEVAIVCPICHHKQNFGQQGGICAGCGLRVNISVEEPRCPACGYSLLMFKGDRCPECGAPCSPQNSDPQAAASLIPNPGLHKSPG
jgi:hypothetical protein